MNRSDKPQKGQGMLIAVAAIGFLVGRWSAQSEAPSTSSTPVIHASAPAESRSLIGVSPSEEAVGSTTLDTDATDASAAESAAEEIEPAGAAPEFVYYRNCSAARAAGAAPIREGDPGYAGHLDRDGDGVACE